MNKSQTVDTVPMSPSSHVTLRKVANQKRFLKAFAKCGHIDVARKEAGISRQVHYHWKKWDEQYAKDFEDARKEAVEKLEIEARRRAIDGVEEPVGFYKGEPSAYVRRYSDVLLIFLLKASKPEMYRERHEHRHVGHDGGALPAPTINVNILSLDTRKQMWDELEKHESEEKSVKQIEGDVVDAEIIEDGN